MRKLMLGWWSDIGEPVIDAGWIATRFTAAQTPSSVTRCSAGEKAARRPAGGYLQLL
jgi:hypothetical protein